MNPDNNIITKNEKDMNKNNSSVCWKLKKSEILLNTATSEILFGLLTKVIRGTTVPIVRNSKNEFIKITNIIKINCFLVCLFKYEINSNILIKYLDYRIYIHFKWSVVKGNIWK